MTREKEVQDQMPVLISRTTREALRNLFQILDIKELTFNDKLMELATRAFSAQADLDINRKTLRKREPAGHKISRYRLEIKSTTAQQLRDVHGKLYPYLPWTSWDWYLAQLADMAEDQLHTGKKNLDTFSG